MRRQSWLLHASVRDVDRPVTVFGYADRMKTLLAAVVLLGVVGAVQAQQEHPLLSGPGPTFTVAEKDLNKDLSIVVYGDMRFTDPTNVKSANPGARKALVAKIAEEKPDAVQLTGDVPLAGNIPADYAEFVLETASWRTAHLRVYPSLGNHELVGPDKQADLENWWRAFPQLKDRRWYSVALGKKIYFLNIDSDVSLLPGSEQRRWIEDQVAHLSKSVEFVFVALHHPPVADVQTHIEVDHNPRENEISLRDFLAHAAPASHARFIVTAGHIHNYERFSRDGVTYLVSGGGGAKPYMVERTPLDLYQTDDFPNFHYVRFTLKGKTLQGSMHRLTEASKTPAEWQIKDTFSLEAK